MKNRIALAIATSVSIISLLSGCAKSSTDKEKQNSYEKGGLTMKKTTQDMAYEMFRWTWENERKTSYLPDWFEENRVQLHTRLGLSYINTPEFFNADKGFKELGAGAFVRHVKTSSEDPWWPSAVPSEEDKRILLNAKSGKVKLFPYGQRNLAKELIGGAHSQGLKMIAYIYSNTDATMSQLHPEWICKDTDGNTIYTKPGDNNRGAHLDISSPYREVILQRLLELAEMGAGGFFFDERHLPREGCWGTALEQSFREYTGLEVPKEKDEKNEIYRLYLDYRNAKIEETFAYLINKVKEKYPDVLFLINTNQVKDLDTHFMTSNLVSLSDSPKSEIQSKFNSYFDKDKNRKLDLPAYDIRQKFQSIFIRDAADGRPTHVWIVDAPNEEHLMGVTSYLISQGCVANLDIKESIIMQDNENTKGRLPREAYRKALALGNKVSPYLAKARPMKFAAVHFSELASNQMASDLNMMWEKVIWPAIGSFGVFEREHVPVGIITDRQLEKSMLEGYKLLFISTPELLTEEQKAVVEKFKANNGMVIYNSSEWKWGVSGKTEEAQKALRDMVYGKLQESFVKMDKAPEKAQLVAFENSEKGHLVVCITNDLSWFEVAKAKTEEERSVENTKPKAPPASGIEVTIRHPNPPKQVLEVVSGQWLDTRPIEGGYMVVIPAFDYMAMLVDETFR